MNQPITFPPEKSFTQLCRVVEEMRDQGLPDLFNSLQAAPVFEFDGQTVEHITNHLMKMPAEELARPPLMPFPEVVLVNDYSIVMFANAKDYEIGENMVDSVFHDEATGCDVTKRVSLLRSVGTVVFSTFPTYDNFPNGFWNLTFGRCKMSGIEESRRLFAMEELTFLTGSMDSAKPLKMSSTLDGKRGKDDVMVKQFGDCAGSAMAQLHYIDLPRHHLIMQEPANRRERSKEKKIPRLRERPTVRLIEPEKVSKIYPRREGGVSGNVERCPHPRRGYTRYLQSEHWKNRRWERIRIRPTWIGEREWTAGAYRFKVVARKNDAPNEDPS